MLVTITTSQVANIMVASELASLTDATQVAAVIAEVCDGVVLAVNTSGVYARLATGRSKVPSELVHSTLVLCRHAIIARAPGSQLNDTLQGGARQAEYQAAQDMLRQVAAGELQLSDYTIGADPADLIDDSESGEVSWGSDPRMNVNII